jgi:hypothetical protein
MSNENDVVLAHKFSIRHKPALMGDEICGCFYCVRIFSPMEIVDWMDDGEDFTAYCPYCRIDSVIGKYSGFPIEKEFLQAMNLYWFAGAKEEEENLSDD